jgi:isoquinoline 1-oxidoreductase beta subunit
MSDLDLHRREFLKGSLAASAGLVIGFYVPMGSRLGAFAAGSAAKVDLEMPNAFIRIAPDNTITVIINKLEMGQGVFTSMAQLIAEELECDWKSIRSESAPVDPVYNHTFFPMQMTSGSTALFSTWNQYRRVGAMAREMLITVAAQDWLVERTTCHAEMGFVVHGPSGRKAAYGDLAQRASQLPKPANVVLKSAKDYKIIGRSVGRVDAAEKSSGRAIYGLDVRLPGMLYAVIARPPVFGAQLKSVDADPARKISGVLDVVRMKNSVAVLAKNTWVARQGRDALKLNWDISPADKVSTPQIFADYKKLAQEPGLVVRQDGDVDAALKTAKHKILAAEYEFPYLAHATMEPMNCTIQYDGKSCEMWAGHQMPTMDRAAAAAVLGLPPEKVAVHTTFAGGSFGRRANKNSDYVIEAAELVKIVKKPLKIVWTREDDMRGGYYRPLYVHRVETGVNAQGLPVGWKHSIVGQSIMANSPLEMMIKNGVDGTLVEGVSDSPYAMQGFSLQLHTTKSKIPSLWWRSVGHTHTAFVMESTIDELAHLVNKDSLEYRKSLLKKSPRHLAVLDLLEKHGGLHHPVQKNAAQGLAIHESFGTVVGHVSHVSVHGDEIQVHKIVSAVHCGTVVNPDSARMQVEGAIAMGLSALLYGQIEVADGQIRQSNFVDYPVLRLKDMPKVEVHFVKTDDPPTGLGEPGLPPVGPAVANAIFKITGHRIRKLPLAGQKLTS